MSEHESTSDGQGPGVILDVDGTLVDSNYQHAIAWFRSFREFGLTLPIWRIHRHIGMGKGDQLVEAVAGAQFEERHGDDVRDAEKRHYEELLPEVCALAGAKDLIEELSRRGSVVLASSAKDRTRSSTTSSSSKPGSDRFVDDLRRRRANQARTRSRSCGDRQGRGQGRGDAGRFDLGHRGREAGRP